MKTELVLLHELLCLNKIGGNTLNKNTVLKVLIIIATILILVLVVYEFYPIMKTLTTREGRINFKNEISKLGFKGMFALYLLEAAQMIFVILPGEPIELLYGMCYGAIWGTILLTIAVFINTVIVCILVKKIGRNILVFFFSEEKVQKMENSKLYNNEKKTEYFLMLLFFLPGTPKYLLLYIGPLLKIDIKKFVLISTFVRMPSVISSTIAGANILNGNLHIVAATYIITALIVLIVILTRKDKKENEIIKDVMEI